jgi:hypothetical protein
MADDDILIEFQHQGAYVKVTAIDAASGREASIIGDGAAARDYLSALAVRKLRGGGNQSAKTEMPGETPSSRRGIIA